MADFEDNIEQIQPRTKRPRLHQQTFQEEVSDDIMDDSAMDEYIPDDSSLMAEEIFTPKPTRGRGRGRGSRGARGGGRGGGIKRPAVPQDFGDKKRGRPGRKPMTEQNVEDPNCLYEIVKQGKSSLQSVVDDWIEKYKQDRDSALLELMQFFVQCSGCRGKITPQMQQSMEHSQIIRKMTEEFDEESGDYPLIINGANYRKFRTNFCEFVQVLVRQCQYSIIYDQYLMDNVISLLTGLSDSQVRAFRHTSTLSAMKLMTALVDVALNTSINLDNTQRQYEAERQKHREKRASERLELLLTKRQELEENMEEIKNMLTYMFKSVFVHRYRDTLPEIRSICMSEIGIWMKKFHQNFLDDSYLKYIGWTLNDKVGDVRLKCLQALQPLYASEDLTPKLELFTNKFKARIVAMTTDKEYDVAVQAVKLVISILKFHQDILSDKDCESVYELVYSSHRAVAQAAGEFINVRLFTPNEEAVRGLKSKRGKQRGINTPLIRDLVQFFIESELHEHGAYLVDSLIESNPMMKDWECMTDLLLEEPGPMEEPLDDRQESSMIEIMCCCVKQSATGDPPVGRGPNRKPQPSAKEIKQVQDDKVKLTEHFIYTLPKLLQKYATDAEKVQNLMTIPMHFDLNVYTQTRQEKNLEDLLKAISEIVDKHVDSEVLELCAKVFEFMCQEDYAVHHACDVSRNTLIDTLVQKYRDAHDEYVTRITSGEEPDEDETFALSSSLKKVTSFYGCHNLGAWDIWTSLFQWVKHVAQEQHVDLPHEIVKNSLWCCYFGIVNDLGTIDDSNPTPEEIQALSVKLHDFMAVCKDIMVNNQTVLQDEAYAAVCDGLLIFSKQLGENSKMRELVYEPDRYMQNQLQLFIQNKVFIEEEDDDKDEHVKIEELHKRRNYLASFCKLIVYNIMSVHNAANVFKHFVRFYNDYGDIIKTTLSKAREINKVNSARTMAISLTSLFKEVQLSASHGANLDRQSESFGAIKELAKRFALSFGLDQVKNREAVAALHREGILFAVNPLENPDDPAGAPPNLPFLDLLCEFTNKLMRQDKKVVLNYLDKHIAAGMPSSNREDWQPLLMYRNSLVHGDNEQPQRPIGKQYSRKRADDVPANEFDEGDCEDEDEFAE